MPPLRHLPSWRVQLSVVRCVLFSVKVQVVNWVAAPYRKRLSVSAFSVAGALVAVVALPAPALGASTHTELFDFGSRVTQSITASSTTWQHAGRDTVGVSEPPPPVDVTGPLDPTGAQAFAYRMLAEYGWGNGQWSCLDRLWTRESNWNASAENPDSGAYGIPQSLPGEKMATVGADWRTNAETQIRWGLSYISGAYGTPCAAWAHSEETNWY